MRKMLLMLSIGVSLVLIGLVLGSGGEPTQPEQAQAGEVPLERASRPRQLGGESELAGGEAGTAPEPESEASPAAKPVELVGAVVALQDEARARMGLPPVMRSLRRARNYRPPTRVEQADPILLQRYLLERKIHGARWTVRHDLEEAGRFRKDAERAKDPGEREFLLKVAAQHEALADKQAQDHADLEQQRMLYQ